ncbi:hypothetical protein GCM10023194_25090 [Planotetraspora phitsanulokensis]
MACSGVAGCGGQREVADDQLGAHGVNGGFGDHRVAEIEPGGHAGDLPGDVMRCHRGDRLSSRAESPEASFGVLQGLLPGVDGGVGHQIGQREDLFPQEY